MEEKLNDVEVRVLGSLIEKEITTPDYYPLSSNALVAACNQSSNREPIVHFDDDAIARALDGLREKKLVHFVNRAESRVTRYRHIAYETMNLSRPAIAVMCVLMLRGPQTTGEIRTRSNRLYDFSSTDELDIVLNSLITAESPMVARLPRQAGQKEVRYAHLLSGELQAAEPEVELDRIGKLEKEVEDLKRQFEQFRKQFE